MNILDWQITKNFRISEFQCHCGCGDVKLSTPLANGLQAMRDILGAISVEAGYRCPKHNAELVKAIHASPTSEHMNGTAADIKNNHDTWYMAKVAYICGFRHINVGKTYIHVDVSTGEGYGTYDSNNIWHSITKTEFLKLAKV
jgi:hypothetical protein